MHSQNADKDKTDTPLSFSSIHQSNVNRIKSMTLNSFCFFLHSEELMRFSKTKQMIKQL